MKTQVHFHIDRLVFDGFAMTPVERAAVVSSVQTELGRLLSENGLGPAVTGFAVPTIDAGTMQPSSPSVNPSLFGRELAHALYNGLKGQSE